MRSGRSLPILLAGLSLWTACAGMRPTRFVNPRFNFDFVERVAVLPFENLSNDPKAHVRAARLLVTELLSTGAVEVVEPGEVSAALGRLRIETAAPGKEQILELGKVLGVQALILGSVNQSETIRSGNVPLPVVTLDVHMVETETGSTIWAATHTEKGSGFGAKFLGTGGEPLSETMRRCVKRIVLDLTR